MKFENRKNPDRPEVARPKPLRIKRVATPPSGRICDVLQDTVPHNTYPEVFQEKRILPIEMKIKKMLILVVADNRGIAGFCIDALQLERVHFDFPSLLYKLNMHQRTVPRPRRMHSSGTNLSIHKAMKENDAVM